jgi:hypothetical protein
MRDMQLRFHPGVGPPARARQLWRRTWLQRHRAGVTLAAAAGLALLAVRVATITPSVPVFVDRAGYHVGDRVMVSQDGHLFTGDAAIAVVQDGALARAGASTVYEGQHTTGHCVMSGAREACVFSIGAVVLSCEDHLDRDGGQVAWERSYRDGRSVRIPIPEGSPVPVPLPLGR